jgi:hypothetical protein
MICSTKLFGDPVRFNVLLLSESNVTGVRVHHLILGRDHREELTGTPDVASL